MYKLLTCAFLCAASKVLDRFRLLGRAMAKALQDNRLLDIPLSYAFYRQATRTHPTTLQTMHGQKPSWRCHMNHQKGMRSKIEAFEGE